MTEKEEKLRAVYYRQYGAFHVLVPIRFKQPFCMRLIFRFNLILGWHFILSKISWISNGKEKSGVVWDG
jgi:hypothetical protein